MKRNRAIKVSILVTIASLLLPFKATVGNEIYFGYPFRFLTIFKSAFTSVNTGWHSTVLKFIGIDLFAFCLDVAVIYVAAVALEKIKKKLTK